MYCCVTNSAKTQQPKTMDIIFQHLRIWNLGTLAGCLWFKVCRGATVSYWLVCCHLEAGVVLEVINNGFCVLFIRSELWLQLTLEGITQCVNTRSEGLLGIILVAVYYKVLQETLMHLKFEKHWVTVRRQEDHSEKSLRIQGILFTMDYGFQRAQWKGWEL